VLVVRDDVVPEFVLPALLLVLLLVVPPVVPPVVPLDGLLIDFKRWRAPVWYTHLHTAKIPKHIGFSSNPT